MSSELRYDLDIDIGNDGLPDLTGYFEGYYGWLGAMYVKAEGNSLEELFKDCIVETCNQDGGEGPSVDYEALPKELKEHVRKLVIKEYLAEVKTLCE